MAASHSTRQIAQPAIDFVPTCKAILVEPHPAIKSFYAKNYITYVVQYFRCCQKGVSGMDSAQLLSKLDYDEILSVFSCENFNISILQDCLQLATQITLQVH
ncbi:hypothetical protein PR048_030361 [Dryococelus australis]|uniref:Uncharacterized protein n=1 Tax=Dryococelus australis TaxID=614101 RepID=A0ABQ9G8S4_9NEOP|nr:hypothetical protein PR048_030361 [Dryococelus australis]